MIDIFIPVLGRPDNAEPVAASAAKNTRFPYRLLFICSDGDAQQISACFDTQEDVMVMDHPAGRSDYPKKMNAAYRASAGEWMLMGSDDITFEPGWDGMALSVAAQKQASVVATNDLANAQVKSGRFGTHSLVSRNYVNDQGGSMDGPGVLIHEGYDHNFCDRELCHVAQWRGVYSFAKRSHIRHRHPIFGGAQMDETYEKGRANFAEDQRLFYERSKLWGYVGLGSSERAVASGRRTLR